MNQHQRIDLMARALEYYASPSTWANTFLWCDSPCGDLPYDVMDLVSGLTPGYKPGQLARAAVDAYRIHAKQPAVDWHAHHVRDLTGLLDALDINESARYAHTQQKDDPNQQCCDIADEAHVERFDPSSVESLLDGCPRCGADVHESELADFVPSQERAEYVCGAEAFACGHLHYTGWGEGRVVCAHLAALRDRAQAS